MHEGEKRGWESEKGLGIENPSEVQTEPSDKNTGVADCIGSQAEADQASWSGDEDSEFDHPQGGSVLPPLQGWVQEANL